MGLDRVFWCRKAAIRVPLLSLYRLLRPRSGAQSPQSVGPQDFPNTVSLGFSVNRDNPHPRGVSYLAGYRIGPKWRNESFASCSGPFMLHSLPQSSAIRGKESTMAQQFGEEVAVRDFHIDVPEEELVDLRQRIAATRWPTKELVEDRSQGVQLVTIQKVARYWVEEYDWRKVEAKLKSYPQFITNIDGLDIHFIHVRSKEKNALPVIVTHGWPGSIIEQLKIIDPLTNPTAYSRSA